MATGVKTDTGRVREGNEDRYLVREERDITLLAVADGVGGSSGGEIAADAALAELGTRFFGARSDRATSDALGEAMRDANAAVLRAAGTSGHHDAATTIVAAAVRADEAIIANLGDSRAYLIRDGICRQLTEDHSGAMEHAITRFAGDPRGIQPDIFVESLRPDDRLLLCSDGLTRYVTPEEIASTTRRSRGPPAASPRSRSSRCSSWSRSAAPSRSCSPRAPPPRPRRRFRASPPRQVRPSHRLRRARRRHRSRRRARAPRTRCGRGAAARPALRPRR